MQSDNVSYGDEGYRGLETSAGPNSLRRIFGTISSYRGAILMALLSIMVAYVILMIGFYLYKPRMKMSSVAFRLEFFRADEGKYPNGSRFSSADIVASPVLAEVYRQNHLSQYLPYNAFKDAVFVVESNQAVEGLEREYKMRLDDSRLDPVDRERIEKEYKSKSESLRHAEYALNIGLVDGVVRVPKPLTQKILNDILETWAEQAERERGVLQYDQTVFTRNILDPNIFAAYDYIIAVDIMRSKVRRIIRNMDELMELPGAAIVRAGPQRESLAELRLRFGDIVQFKIQPLIGAIMNKGLSRDPQKTIQFFQSQLTYNEMERNAANARVDTLRDALDTYTRSERNRSDVSGSPSSAATQSSSLGTQPAVIPQLGESFLDRLLDFTSESSDTEYRQKFTERITEEALAAIPLETEADYYTALITSFKGFEARARSARPDEATAIESELNEIFQESVQAIDKVNVLYNGISENLNPVNELYTVTRAPTEGIVRSVSPKMLGLVGIFVFLLSLPILIAGCLIYDRVLRESPVETLQIDKVMRAAEATE